MKLNLGCGRDIRNGWVNIDLHPLDLSRVRAGDVADLGLWFGIKKASCERIFAGAIIEHFDRHAWKQVLAQWCSFLAPGGIIEIETHDLKVMAARFLSGVLTDEQYVTLLYGAQDDELNYHKWGMTKGMFRAALEACGMVEVEFGERHNLLTVRAKASG